MSEVVISYAREDRDAVERFAAMLGKAGISVWWDKNLRAGQGVEDGIKEQIARARAVIVLWTEHSIHSKWVFAEAMLAGDKLFPVRIANAAPPTEFVNRHTLDLDGSSDVVIANLKAVLRPSRLRRRLSWAAVAAAAALVLAVLVTRTPMLANSNADAVAAQTVLAGEQEVAQLRAASDALQPSAPSQLAPTPEAERGIRPVPEKSSNSANSPDGAAVQIDICLLRDPERCNPGVINVGELVFVRITSRVSGRLILLDENSAGATTQVFPNGLSAAGANLSIEAGEPLVVPRQGMGFRYQVQEPIGVSRLFALIVPSSAPLPQIVEANARSRSLGVIPEDSQEDLDRARTYDGAAQGERRYAVER